MKMKTVSMFLLVSLVCSLSAHAAPLTKAQNAAMKAVYATQDKALMQKNVDALIALTDVNFQRKSQHETRTGQKLEREYTIAGFEHVKAIDQAKTTILRSAFAVNKIVIMAQTTMSGIFRNSPREKWERASYTMISRDTWILTKNGWRIRLTEDV